MVRRTDAADIEKIVNLLKTTNMTYQQIAGRMGYKSICTVANIQKKYNARDEAWMAKFGVSSLCGNRN